MLLDDSERSVSLPATLYGSGTILSALGFYLLMQETPTERICGSTAAILV